jgi:hypothetical protein
MEKKAIKTTTVSFNSSTLDTGTYNHKTRDLIIRFKKGAAYLYSDVPEPIWDGLVKTSSPGTYHAQNIKENYQFTKL